MKSFDKKFGSSFFESIPLQPGIYRVYNESGELIYVGKAKNLRRRLGQYRNAKRRKKHLKMREIIAHASTIEWTLTEDEKSALLLENRIIQEQRPRFNVEGAFYFLYPVIAFKRSTTDCDLFFTTRPELLEAQPQLLQHGAFRSRFITGEAFFSLCKLLQFIGHQSKTKPAPRLEGGGRLYHFKFRRVPDSLLEKIPDFFDGTSRAALEQLILELVDHAGARRQSKKIQEHLNNLQRFYRHEAGVLAHAREKTSLKTRYIPQKERDALFICARKFQQTKGDLK